MKRFNTHNTQSTIVDDISQMPPRYIEALIRTVSDLMADDADVESDLIAHGADFGWP